MIFVLRLNPEGTHYTFEQVPQCLLAGDNDQPIPR